MPLYFDSDELLQTKMFYNNKNLPNEWLTGNPMCIFYKDREQVPEDPLMACSNMGNSSVVFFLVFFLM